MHDVKHQLEESFYEILLLLFSQTLYKTGTASFGFKMKVLRTLFSGGTSLSVVTGLTVTVTDVRYFARG